MACALLYTKITFDRNIKENESHHYLNNNNHIEIWRFIMKFKETVKRFIKDDNGISAVEYALLLALIGGGIASAAFLLGGQVKSNIDTAKTSLAGTP